MKAKLRSTEPYKLQQQQKQRQLKSTSSASTSANTALTAGPPKTETIDSGVSPKSSDKVQITHGFNKEDSADSSDR